MKKNIIIFCIGLILFSLPLTVQGAWATYPHVAIRVADGKDIDLAGTTIRNGSFEGLYNNNLSVGNGILENLIIPRQADIYQKSFIQINNTYNNPFNGSASNYTNDFAAQFQVRQRGGNALVSMFAQCINQNNSNPIQSAGCWAENLAGFAEGDNSQAVASEVNYGNAPWAYSGGMRFVSVPVINTSNALYSGRPEWPILIQSQSKNSTPKEGITFNSAVDSWDGGNWAQPSMDSLVYIPQNFASATIQNSTWVNNGIDFHLGNFNGSAFVSPMLNVTANTGNWNGLPRNHGLEFANTTSGNYIYIDGNETTVRIWNGSNNDGNLKIEQNPWTNATLYNFWERLHPEASWENASYRKNSLGEVELRGLIGNGDTGLYAFTLPIGYRPRYTTHLAVAAGGQITGEAKYAYISIETNGVVTPFNQTGITSLSLNSRFALD